MASTAGSLVQRTRPISRDEPGDVKIAPIRSLLANLPLDTVQTIEQITPHRLKTLWRALGGEGERGPLKGLKFFYLEEAKKLIVMNPSFAHQGFLLSLSRITNGFLGTLGHDKRMFNFVVATNMSLDCATTGNIGRKDFQVLIENNYSGTWTLKWIGEVCFTASSLDTRSYLRQVVARQPHIDLAFMITIEEDPKWVSPGNGNEALHQLQFQPLLTHAEFKSNVGDTLGSVIKGGFAWISIREITFEVYLRSSSGSLVIGDAKRDKSSAHGTLYPTVSMLDVDLLLLDASDVLRDSLVSEMEGTSTSAASIDRVRQSPANLIIDWEDALLSYRTAVVMAAYERYREWHQSTNSERELENSEENTNSA